MIKVRALDPCIAGGAYRKMGDIFDYQAKSADDVPLHLEVLAVEGDEPGPLPEGDEPGPLPEGDEPGPLPEDFNIPGCTSIEAHEVSSGDMIPLKRPSKRG